MILTSETAAASAAAANSAFSALAADRVASRSSIAASESCGVKRVRSSSKPWTFSRACWQVDAGLDQPVELCGVGEVDLDDAGLLLGLVDQLGGVLGPYGEPRGHEGRSDQAHQCCQDREQHEHAVA
jgi:hypothetical protein